MEEINTQGNTGDVSTQTIGSTTTSWGEGSKNTPTLAVLSAVADASGNDPLELPPLIEAIDPETLNDVFSSGLESTVKEITFQYAGYDVVVRGNGHVQARPTGEA